MAGPAGGPPVRHGAERDRRVLRLESYPGAGTLASSRALRRMIGLSIALCRARARPAAMSDMLPLDAEQIEAFLIATGIGLLIGLERGWQERDLPEGGRVAGLRTFALVGLLGGVLGSWLPRFGPWPLVAALLGVALLLAVALSEVSPRQGRYLKLFPALLIFASLIVALMAVKTRISKEEMGIWAYPLVLMVYAIAAALFSRKQKLAPKIKKQIQRVRS